MYIVWSLVEHAYLQFRVLNIKRALLCPVSEGIYKLLHARMN